MSETTAPVHAPVHQAWPMYRAMVTLGLVCGALIVVAFQWTLPAIEANKAAALQKAVFRVVPGAAATKPFQLVGEDRITPLEGEPAPGTRLVYAAYDASGAFAGIAVESQGMGYQDVIRVLWGYSPAKNAIVGMQVLESKETPGLGDAIENNAAFLANFVALDVTLDAAGQALANRIVAVKNSQKQHAWQVDGITGATVSSKAIASILDGGAGEWVPRLRQNLSVFEEAK